MEKVDWKFFVYSYLRCFSIVILESNIVNSFVFRLFVLRIEMEDILCFVLIVDFSFLFGGGFCIDIVVGL